ncbi:uncharacterized protein [Triticum aestivum]|uniref:uncharacterized protein n=1 Tax=Triticum aestivum TaxID=4565 RepID=UPI001D015E64|nr:uncharacterized protein LOC123170725 [Triticum aestivum]
MRSSVHVPAAVEALLGHPVAALSERRAPRLTRLLLNVTVERSLWPVHVLLGADATVADLACAAVAAYAAEGRRPPLPADDTATDAAARFEWPRQSRQSAMGGHEPERARRGEWEVGESWSSSGMSVRLGIKPSPRCVSR